MEIERIERIDVISPPPPVETELEKVPDNTKKQEQPVTEPERIVDIFA